MQMQSALSFESIFKSIFRIRFKNWLHLISDLEEENLRCPLIAINDRYILDADGRNGMQNGMAAGRFKNYFEDKQHHPNAEELKNAEIS